MKIKAMVVTLGIGLVVLVTAVLLFHFGPIGIRSGEHRILDSIELTNGRLFLVAERTGHPIDAYRVSLFRVQDPTNVFVCWLGHEDGYWWGSSLAMEPSQEAVEIRVYGVGIASYAISNGLVTWHDPAQQSLPSYRIDGVKIRSRIPDRILMDYPFSESTNGGNR